MSSWFILLFALMQGLLEWLPVSSQGQTVSLLVAIVQLDEELAFQIAIWLHLGTMLAVIVKYRKELFQYLNLKNKDPDVIQWRKFLIYSTLGTVITGVPCFLLVRYLIQDNTNFGEYIMLVIGIALIVTAALLFYSERKKKQLEFQEGEMNEKDSDIHSLIKQKSIENLSVLQMTASGLFQGFSIIPGISRSGITMSGLLFMGTKKEDAIKGSFLMSIPAVLGGFILDLIFSAIDVSQNGGSIIPIDWWLLLIAILLTAVIGYLTMELFLFVARKYNFSLLCLILGILTIILFAVRFAA